MECSSELCGCNLEESFQCPPTEHIAENADAAKALTPDEARRIAANIANCLGW